MPGSGKFQRVIDASARAERRRKVAGYILTGLTVIGLVWICWYVYTMGDNRRFRGIEKFRGAVPGQIHPSFV